MSQIAELAPESMGDMLSHAIAGATPLPLRAPPTLRRATLGRAVAPSFSARIRVLCAPSVLASGSAGRIQRVLTLLPADLARPVRPVSPQERHG